jgi:hypothetical protein
VLKDELGNSENHEGAIERVWSFREILSWKMPDHLSTNSAKNLNRAVSRVHAGLSDQL